jgi:hypothetical protein
MRFEALRETLLKGGVAPRHVRRYLAELSEHLDDLTAQQREAGYDAEDAAIRARARLGDDDRLAQAMLEQPGMRSWPARLPWLVFVALPPAATLLLGTLLYATVYFIGNGAAKINAVVPLPQNWLIGFSAAAMTAISVLAVPMAATLLALLADRQRLKPLWPLLGIALLLLATPMFSSKFGHHHDGYLRVNYGLVIATQWSVVVRFWPLMLSHLLALLPVAWLIHRRRSAA